MALGEIDGRVDVFSSVMPEYMEASKLVVDWALFRKTLRVWQALSISATSTLLSKPVRATFTPRCLFLCGWNAGLTGLPVSGPTIVLIVSRSLVRSEIQIYFVQLIGVAGCVVPSDCGPGCLIGGSIVARCEHLFGPCTGRFTLDHF